MRSSVRRTTMPEVLIAFIVGLPVAIGLIPLSHRLGLLDRPGLIKPHARPIPYPGGTVIALVLVAVGVLSRLPVAPLLAAVVLSPGGVFVSATRLSPSLSL